MLLGGYIDSLGYLEGNGPSDFPKVLFYGTHCRGGIMHSRAMLSKCGPGILGVPEPSGVPTKSTLFLRQCLGSVCLLGTPFLAHTQCFPDSRACDFTADRRGSQCEHPAGFYQTRHQRD